MANNSVLVVGGGPAGMQAALLLAASGVQVHLVDRAPAIGGHMPLLDKTFPTDSCGLCFMSPRPAAYCPFVECERSERVEVLPSTELVGLSGEPGAFSARLLERARGVDTERCTGCGRCAEACPVTVPRELGDGLETRQAIYRPFPQAVPDSYLIDWDGCTRCGECGKACPRDAIDLEAGDSERVLGVGAVILATGFRPVDAAIKTEYGYGRYPNVVTSIQMERMLSRGGPSRGLVLRPSDGEKPRRIAFLQCVGSRDPSCGHDYCSSVCCMYAAKQAALLRERSPEATVVVFQMDRRSFGKGYDRYVDRIDRTGGVEYRRSAVSAVKQVPGSLDLLVSFVDSGAGRREESFDLVVLSVGMEPSQGVAGLAERLGLPLNGHGFPESDALWRTESPVPGVLVAGGGREPMDVADAVAEGAAAAAAAMRWVQAPADGLSLHPHPDPLPGGEGIAKPPLPGGEGGGEGSTLLHNAAPQAAVLLCNCGGEIGGRIDLAALAKRLEGYPGVCRATVVDRLCREGGETVFREATGGADRVVVAACARRKVEGRLDRLAREAGLTRGLLEVVNLREQCAWVHLEGGPGVETKAEALVAMGVTGLLRADPVPDRAAPLESTALVVGGGAAGMVAAATLAERGVEVWLAEREAELGGGLRVSDGALGSQRGRDALQQLRLRAEGSGRVHVMTGAEVTRIDGHLGAFRCSVMAEDGERQLEHSVVLLATGVEEAEPEEYLLGRHPATMTLSQLGRQLDADPGWAERHPRIAMFLCAGSLEEGQNYCSRTCCSDALESALKIKGLNPEAEVYLLHREMRSYGFQDERYEAARRAGVLFLRYEVGAKPEVAAGGETLVVTVFEPHLGLPVVVEVDALVLAVGVRPRQVDGLARSLGVEMDENGFFVEANVKTRSTEARRPGVFLGGTCQGPRSVADTVIHAQAAAMRASALLLSGEMPLPATGVTVNERICSGCGLCVEACAYGARVLDPERNVSTLLEVLCQGCGACAAACPNGATQQQGFAGRQMVAVLDEALE